MKKLVILLSTLVILIVSCKNEANTPASVSATESEKKPAIIVPDFNADSAYYFVEKQVSFGPRVPGTEAHNACAHWLASTLTRFGGELVVQDFKTRVYHGKVYDGKNIIASFNPKANKRVMLSAHWDSRPYADYDPNPEMRRSPIAGANDGASGVGVILEIARQMQKQSPQIGVDVFFWDLEDYGEHKDEQGSHENSWGLGSQYWSANPHQPAYQANYGILLDMVGAANPKFYHEYYSRQYAPHVLKKVWDAAAKLGYGNVFINEDNGVIMDDHYYINTIAGIPTIDIIHYDRNQKTGFFPEWHTQGDNMDIIERSSLEMVGKTLMQALYHE